MKMPRKPRIHYEGALYHVIVRGNNKDYVFKSDEMKLIYLKKIRKYLEKYRGKLYAYVIMYNHAHMLIEVSDIPLSKSMQLIQQTFTQYYNKINKRTGHVFEQRYKAILCNKDEYLLSLIRYIHKNPVRAGIDDINYIWSSHKEYTECKSIYCDVEFPLNIFSNNKKEAIKAYLKFINEEENIEDENDYEYIPEKAVRNYKEELNIDLSYKEFLEQFIKKKDIKYEELKGRARNRNISKIKEEFIKTVIRYKILSQRELSEELSVSEQTISRIVNKV